MSKTKFEVRTGTYFDSVLLMQLQVSLNKLPGIEDAGVMMATPANREILEATGFSLEQLEAGNDDLIIAVRAADDEAATSAIAQVDELLKGNRTSGGSTSFRSKSLSVAAEMHGDAGWVLVSVPGKFAADVAHEALDLGRHVFLYSDNVSLTQEVKLKEKARDKGLLVMGPDCGTAMIDGAGFGFANRVRPDNIGIVAASGTGAQAVAVAIDARGGGISQLIGTGGRDLKTEVGGITFFQALHYLANDADTNVIVLISKPPAPETAGHIMRTALGCGKPVVINFIGMAIPGRQAGNLHFAVSLDHAAEIAAQIALNPSSQANGAQSSFDALSGCVRGFFSGGTLAYEAMLALQPVLTPLYSNVPIHPHQTIEDVWQSQAHTIIDMGEDDFTQGRLHPMMDNSLRLLRIEQEAADPQVGLILLDVVLGEGAHHDPASELAPLIRKVKVARPELIIVVLMIGTDADPQNMESQISTLTEAGAVVYRTIGEVMDDIYRRVAVEANDARPIQWPQSRGAINVGVESFAGTLSEQGFSVTQVDWRPPAGGNEKMMSILAKFKQGS